MGIRTALQTAKLSGEEVDAQDAFKLLRRLTLPPQWLPPDSQPIDMASVRRAKVGGCGFKYKG